MTELGEKNNEETARALVSERGGEKIYDLRISVLFKVVQHGQPHSMIKFLGNDYDRTMSI